jgi:hypothetical protein
MHLSRRAVLAAALGMTLLPGICTAKELTGVVLPDEARLFVWGLDKGLADNTPAAELAALAEQAEKLRAAIRSLDSLKDGARVNVDYLPGAGTRVYLGERALSEPIPGKAFNDALSRVWVGQRPLDAGLREALLGA